MHLLYCISLSLIVISSAIEDLQSTSEHSETYWKNILRDIVFKTISSPLKFNDTLYKKILEAPFYGKSLPEKSSMNNKLLSRGEVFYLQNNSWILCQEDCENCELCKHQKDSIVKWTLRRMRRFISSRSYRYDLQLTVVPQTTFHTDNYVYADGNKEESSSKMISSHETNSRRLQRDENGLFKKINDKINNLNHQMIKSTREKSNYRNENSLNLHVTDNEDDMSKEKPHHRMILEIDECGKLVVTSLTSTSITDEPITYEKYVEKIVKSLHNHKPIIETFLSRLSSTPLPAK